MIYFEGFHGIGAGTVITYLTRRGHTIHAAASTGTCRFTGVSLKLDQGEDWIIPVTLGVSHTIGFAMRVDGASFNDSDFLTIQVDTTAHITLSLRAGEISVKTAAETILTTDLRHKPAAWTYIEFKFIIDNSNGSYVLKVNGEERLNRTGIDTYNTETMAVNNFKFCHSAIPAMDLFVDDVYINDDFLDDIRIDPIDPDGDGAITDWTPLAGDNYDNVNEYDIDATYVQTSTTTHQDLYTYDNLSVLGTIHAVQMNVGCRTTDANDFNIEQLVRISAGIHDETPIAVAGQTYETIVRVIEENPSTSTAWTVTAINAAQFGFEATT